MGNMGRLEEIVLIFVSCASIHITQAANWHCKNVSVSMRQDTSQAETLLTNLPQHDHYVASQVCVWNLSMSEFTEPHQLILQHRKRPMSRFKTGQTPETQSAVCDTELSVQLMGSNFRAVWNSTSSMPSSPIILPVISSNQQLLVTFSTGDSEPSKSCDRVELQVSTVVKGYCGRHMLLSSSRCHLISDRQLSITDLNETGLRQSPFSDMAHVQHLLRDNDARVHEYPYIRPLNVSSAVRVAVFQCPGSVRPLFYESVNGSCVSHTFNWTGLDLDDRAPSSVQCASVQVNGSSGELQFRFSDCRHPMRSLLSFSESPTVGVDPCDRQTPCEGVGSLEGDGDSTSFVIKNNHFWLFDQLFPETFKASVAMIIVLIAIPAVIYFCCRKGVKNLELSRTSSRSNEQKRWLLGKRKAKTSESEQDNNGIFLI